MSQDIDLDEYDYWVNGERYAFMPEEDLPSIIKSVPMHGFTIIKKEKSAGCKCEQCDNFFEYAEPNQENGTFRCWGCRH